MKVYELVVRHFLACVSKDAEGRETTIEIDVNNERVKYPLEFFIFLKNTFEYIFKSYLFNLMLCIFL